MTKSIGDLERWNGGFPGEHEFSDLEGLVLDEANPELAVFLEASTNLIENWHGNKFTGLYLYETPGNGKTHAAIGLGRALHEAGAEVFYKYSPQLVEDTKQPINQGLRYWARGRLSSDVRHSSSTTFPLEEIDEKIERNPRVALIVDDYRPEAQETLHLAVDAAAQYGGLVIVTSNFTDPFKLVEVINKPRSDGDIEREAILEHFAPETASQLQERRTEAAKAISDSLRSRIASAFKLIQFDGEDRRPQASFWS